MIEVIQYNSDYKSLWNNYISKSKNGTFLFYRDYMEYHSNRFKDNSLMFFEGDRLIAVMPANIYGNVLYSHAGLTYGGIISDQNMTISKMLGIFPVLMKYCSSSGIKKVIYKAIPHIYHIFPAEEDLYAIFRYEGTLIRRDVSSTIYLKKRIKFSKNRRRCVRKAEKSNLIFKQTDDFNTYWTILTKYLEQRHSKRPVHTIEEISYLHEKFPENIKLFCSFKNEDMLAGIVIYESSQVAHAQYMICTEIGNKIGALDFLIENLIDYYCETKRYFDFGISTEKEGLYLNEGLSFFKEGFGARTVVYDHYEITI